jgi:hypothetical protein
MKDVLIVCYGFPPNPGIGGRRWGKFAKYLVQKGYKVTVIACENTSNTSSTWTKDVASPNIKCHFLPLHYPKVFIDPPKNIFEKIKLRIFKSYYQLIQSKRIYDKSFLWEQQFLAKAEEIIVNENIQNVIVTGAPFYLMYYTALLKNKFPNLNLIADYRDPWIGEGGIHYGMNNLSPNKLILEERMQNFVYEQANYITAPNTFLLDNLKKSLKIEYSDAKFVELPHAYDTDDLKEYLKLRPVKNNQKIRFVYGGTLYIGTDKILEELAEFLSQLRLKDFNLYHKLSFEFYTPDQVHSSIFVGHKEIVNFFPTVGDTLFKHIAATDICMLFLADHNKDFCTTKFFEFLPFKKPYMLMGARGFVAETIEKKKLGWFFQSGSISETFYAFLKNDINTKLELYLDNDISEYSFDSITDKLIGLLK